MLSIDYDVSKTELQKCRDVLGIKWAAQYAAYLGLPLGVARAWLLEK